MDTLVKEIDKVFFNFSYDTNYKINNTLIKKNLLKIKYYGKLQL